MARQYRWRHRVEFSETDMAGIVHFANYFRYMEMAEHAFLRSMGLSVHAQTPEGLVSWPRVKAECSYRAPLTFDDELEVLVEVRDQGAKTLVYDFRITKEGDQLVATGSITVVCVAIDRESHRMTSIAIPEWFSEKLAGDA